MRKRFTQKITLSIFLLLFFSLPSLFACDGSGYVFNGITDNGDGTFTLNMTIHIAGGNYPGGILGGTQGFYFSTNAPGGMISVTPLTLTSLNGTSLTGVISGSTVTWGTPGAGPYFVTSTEPTQTFDILVTVSGFPSMWNGGGMENNGCPGGPGTSNPSPGYSGTICLPPSIQVLPPPDPICAGEPITLEAIPSLGSTVMWSNGQTGSTITYVPTVSTTLTATAQSGCGNASGSIPITVNPQPTLAPFPAIDICQGELITLTANAQNADLIEWDNGFFGPTIVFAPDESNTITVTASNICGAVNQLVPISVTPLPILAVLQGDQIICQGEIAELEVYVENATNFSWSNGPPTPAIVVSPTQTTVYTATASNDCLTLQEDIVVEVLPLPTIDVIQGDQAICQGQSAILNIFADNADDVAWNTGSNNAQITVTPGQTTDYTVSATNTCGTVQEAITVEVLTPPTLSVLQGDQAICQGASATLSVDVQNEDALNWSTGSSNPSITVSPAQDQSFTVTATNSCGQVDTTLNIDIQPPPTLSVVQGAQDICEGDSITLAIDPEYASIIQWTGGSLDSSITVSPMQSTTYTVMVSNNCGQADTAFTINVAPLPVLNVLQGSQAICDGQSATLLVEAINADNLQWSTGTTDSTLVVSPAQTENFLAVASNGCGQDSALLTVTVNPTYDNPLNLEACPGTSVTYAGVSLAPGDNQSFTLSTIAGCDSIVNVTVIELPAFETDLSLQACTGSAATYNGTMLPPGAMQSFTFTAANGCDSTVNVTVQEVSIIEQDLALQTCPGATIDYNGTALAPGDSQSFSFVGQSGCDSIVNVTVIALPTFESDLLLETCTGATIDYNGAALPPGTEQSFTYVAANGCDSTVNVTVMELPTFESGLSFEACSGTAVDYNGTMLDAGDSQSFTFTALNGCDSTVNVTIIELPVFETSLTLEACTGTTVNYNGTTLNPGDFQPFLYTAANGCDSTVNVAVTELPVFESSLTLEACTGTTATYAGETLDPGDSQRFTFTADNGCDSTVNVSVIELPTFETSLTLEACTGTTADYNGTPLNPGDNQPFLFTAANGCDSTVNVNVVELPTYERGLALQACTGFTVDYNGTTLNPGDVQSFTFNTQNGCDSVVNVTVIEVTVLEESLEFDACPGTTVSYNGATLNPGEAQDFTFTSQTGCDSIVTVSVIELPTFASSLTLEACTGTSTSYNGATLFPGDSQPFTLVAANGCDSVVTVTVQELSTFESNIQLQACPGTTVSYAGETLDPGDSQSFTLTAQNGCDSIVNVSVLELPTFEQGLVLQACIGSTITYNGTSLIPGDNQSFTLTAQNGCDSVVNVTVTGVEIFETDLDLAACSGTSVTYNGTVLPAGAAQDFTFTSQIGCDSIVSVNVLELPVYEQALQLETCEGTTLSYNGAVLAPGATQSFTLISQDGCDSVVNVSVLAVDTIATFEQRSICTGDSALIFGQYETTPGLYTQTSLSYNGCDSTHRVELSRRPLPVITYNAEGACPEEANGSAMLSANGASSPYNFRWPDGNTNASRANLAPGAYTITVTDATGCRQSAIVQVPERSITIESDIGDISCFGEKDGFIAISASGANGLRYSLDGDIFGGNGFYPNLGPGEYTAYVRDDYNCLYTQPGIIVSEPDKLLILLPPDTTIRKGDSIAILAQANRVGPVQFNWRPNYNISCTDCNPPSAYPEESVYYYVTARDGNGCTADDRILIYVDKFRGVYIPNAFSPNGDGANDVFYIFADESVAEIKSFLVFNRWGEAVFESYNFQPNNPIYGWDGIFRSEVLNPAVFAYMAEIEFKDGEVVLFKGDVTLAK
ncbi:MAG: gliding motility-associated C-terminal domain-containing protein [Lewinellaceae bacterium]|nr:gliding motility-associated C-terminal domain-containing protein [Lewinellaceae bacterium]